MPKLINLVGRRFGRLTVQEHSGKNKRGDHLWSCVCDCGKHTVVTFSHLRSSHTRSCACLHDEVAAENARAGATHGQSRSGQMTPEYKTWASMITRCENRNSKSYRYYGARGIRVCGRWRRSFQAFFADMGKRPSLEHSIHRLRNDRGYCPSNCVYATRWEQARHMQTTKLTQAKADKIRARYSIGGISQRALAVEYGTTQSNISFVVRGVTWALPPKKPSVSVALSDSIASPQKRSAGE